MSESGKSTPDSRTWGKEVAGTERGKLSGGDVKSGGKEIGMGGATGCERPNNLQHKKFGNHGPD